MKKIHLAGKTPKQELNQEVRDFIASGRFNKILGSSNEILVGNSYTPTSIALQNSLSFLDDDFQNWNENERKKARKALRQWQNLDSSNSKSVQLFETEFIYEGTEEKTPFGQSLEYALQRLNKIEYLNILCTENSLSVSALAGISSAISTTQEFTQILGTDSKTLTDTQLEYIYTPNSRMGNYFVADELAQICAYNKQENGNSIIFICVAVGIVQVGNFEQKVRLFVLSEDLENFLKAGKPNNKKEK